MRKKATSFIKALSLFLIMTAIFTMSAACKNEDKVIVNSISLDVETLTLYVGDTAELTALTDPEGVILKWSSSDPSIATVDNGTVNAIGEGDAIIEVSSGGKTAQCEVTVRVPLPVLSFSEYSYTILGRENLRVDLNAQNANGKDVLWSVSGNSVSIDDSKNTITDNASYVILNPLEAGLSTVTATVDEVECSFDVEVKDDYELIIGDIYLDKDFILTESTYELDVLLTVNGNESTDYSGIEWTSSNVSIATIENGIISTQNATGEVTITATIDNATATSIFTVYKGIANITDWNLIKDDLNGYYVLTSDINFNKAEVDTIAPYNLTGPSSETSYYPQHSNFAGILDGNGYTISNVKPVSRGGTAGAVDQYTALFGTVAPSGIIRNVSIIGLEGTRCAAGVAFWSRLRPEWMPPGCR